MSQQPGPLQTILESLPNIIKSLPALKTLFESRKSSEGQDEATASIGLSIQDLNRTDIEVIDTIKSFRKMFKVVEVSQNSVKTSTRITCDQRVDITLTIEDGTSIPIQTPGIQSMEVHLDEILGQLPTDTVFWLESNVKVEQKDLVKQSPSSSQLIPTNYAPRESTTLTLTNISPTRIRNYEWHLPLQQLCPIYGFELEKGGKRISGQLIQIRLGWMETLDNEELQEIGGYRHEGNIEEHFIKNRRQGPVFSLSTRIDELEPGDKVTLTIFHNRAVNNRPPKQPLGFSKPPPKAKS
jgi:hypothetical protein